MPARRKNAALSHSRAATMPNIPFARGQQNYKGTQDEVEDQISIHYSPLDEGVDGFKISTDIAHLIINGRRVRKKGIRGLVGGQAL